MADDLVKQIVRSYRLSAYKRAKARRLSNQLCVSYSARICDRIQRCLGARDSSIGVQHE
jgi:hypothetical protein